MWFLILTCTFSQPISYSNRLFTSNHMEKISCITSLWFNKRLRRCYFRFLLPKGHWKIYSELLNKLNKLRSKNLIHDSHSRVDWRDIYRLFGSLAADKSPLVPYRKDLADQRRKYGDSVLRKCDEHLATQKAHDGEVQAKLDAARRKRQEEKDEREAIEVRILHNGTHIWYWQTMIHVAQTNRRRPCTSWETCRRATIS